MYKQQKAISKIVNCGPYIPKYQKTRNSTWQLNYSYDFYFKWGDSQQPDATAADPNKKNKYKIPNKQSKRLQIEDPNKQRINTILKT